MGVGFFDRGCASACRGIGAEGVFSRGVEFLKCKYARPEHAFGEEKKFRGFSPARIPLAQAG